MKSANAARVLLPTAVLTVGVLVLSACGGNSSSTDSSAAPASAAATELAGTSWNLSAYADAKGTEVPALTGADTATMTFLGDGTFSGFTGCNRLNGSWVQDGSSLTMTPGPMTKVACSENVTAQEDAIVAALPKVASFTADTALILTAADGSSLLTYTAGTADLAGTSWTATGINNGKEAVEATAGTEKATITFNADGTVSGSTACNTFSGSYTATPPDQLTFGPLAQTMMACEDSLMQIESQYTAALAKVTNYQIEGTTLTLRDADGAMQVIYAQSQ
jgi:heat shock protein HslJ